MSDVRWQRLQELFECMLELAPAQRDDWLRDNEGDARLREEVLALVAAHESRQGGLTARIEHAAHDAADAQTRPGERLGPYVLREEIGSGGMGTVFAADRVDAEFDRRVAIKLIRGIATRDASQRLRRERQILADLSHPNIARLLDGGTSDAGQPYLVMEFIDGVNITDFVRSGKLPRVKRLRLLQQVCRAVHYAHKRLVIHRDLKPANVLVRADGTPVLLDFGIAKLLDAGDSGPLQTQTAVPWFTPAYASPEQRAGRRVSTATDIYGLGVLMHELLTDEFPQRDADGRLPPPSTLRNALGDPGGDRELDIIVGKATHEDPDRRFASAEALANDIERYLRGRPIQAAPDSVGYRTRKFLRRNRWAVAASFVLVAMALVFVWRLGNENERARKAEERAQRESLASARVVDYLIALFDAASPDKIGLRPMSAGELVDAGMRDLQGQLDGQPEAKARLAAALAEIYAKLGENEKGIAAIEDAIALQRGVADPVRLARHLQLYGNLLNATSRHGVAADALLEGIAILEREGADEPGLMAETLTTLSLVRSRTGQMLAAIEDAERAVRIARLVPDRKVTLLGEANNALSEAHLRSFDNPRAVEVARANVRDLETHGVDSGTLFVAREYLAAALYGNGELDEAEALLRSQVEERRKVLDPGSDWLIGLRNQLAAIVRDQGKPLEAVALIRENVEAMRARGQAGSPSYMIALNNLGSLAEHVGDYADAEMLLREALRLADAENDPASLRPDIYRQNLGRILLLAGNYAESLPLIEREIADDGSAERRIDRLRRQLHLGEWYRRNGQFETASTWLDEALENQRATFGDEHPRAAAVQRSRALLARDLGRFDEAEAGLRHALLLGERGVGSESNPVTEIRLELADVLVFLGRHDEARALLERVRANVHAKFAPSAPAIALFERLSVRLGINRSRAEKSTST